VNKISRREFARLGTAAALGTFLPHRSSVASMNLDFTVPEKERPNVIFFMTDDQRWDGMSCTGNPFIETPNMDRLAYEGAIFTNAFVTNSLCGPSRATCLTGKYSHNTGVKVNSGTLPTSQKTFLERARDQGYLAGFVGKWHNKNFGRDRELDYYFGFRGQGKYHDPVIQENNGEEHVYEGWIEDILAGKSIEFIRRAARKVKPFMLCHWFKTPHQTCEPADRHKEFFANKIYPKPKTFYTDYEGKPKAVKEADLRIGGNAPFSYAKDWNEMVRNIYRVLIGVDENLGRILDTLDELGLTENTLVIFTSDNGYFLGEHGFFDKRLMYEPSLRLPLLIRYPKKIKPGTVIDEFALNIDFAPTIMDYAGIPIPKDVDGRSLAPLLEGQPVKWRKDFLYEYYEYPRGHKVRPHNGVRTRRWKYIQYYDFPRQYELYDLENDPEEENNLINDPRYADIVEWLNERLVELRIETGDPDLQFE